MTWCGVIAWLEPLTLAVPFWLLISPFLGDSALAGTSGECVRWIDWIVTWLSIGILLSAAYELLPHSSDPSTSVPVADTPSSDEALHPHVSNPIVQVKNMHTGEEFECNSKEAHHFTCDIGSGQAMIWHRPADPADENAAYFKGKKRTWEYRLQIQFSKDIDCTSLWISTNSPVRPDTSAAGRATHTMVAGHMMRGCRSSMAVHTLGEDPAGHDPEDVVGSSLRTTMEDSDQHVVTRPGEAAPSLFDPLFPSYGLTKARDRAAWQASFKDLVFRAGETHTFGFWGFARFISLTTWTLTFPLMPQISVGVINGPPPIIIKLYTIDKSFGDYRHVRHTPAHMAVMVCFALWSSRFPPPPGMLSKLMAVKCQRPIRLDDDAPLSEECATPTLQPQHQQQQLEHATPGIAKGGCLSWVFRKRVPRSGGAASSSSPRPQHLCATTCVPVG